MQRLLYSNSIRKFSSKSGVYPDRFVNYFLKPEFYTYQDNSQIIEKIFNNNFTECILAPQGYGKTFSMETLKYFLSCNSLIEEKVDKQTRYNFFKNLKVHNWTEFNSHFANYPVISLNFSELDCSSHLENLEKFRFMVALQFEQVLQFLNKEENSPLTTIDLKSIDEFFANFKSYNETHLLNACKSLGKILLKTTHQNPFYLIDDYDFPLINSLNKGFYEETLNFLQNFVNIVMKNNNFLNKTLITGVNLIESKRLFASIGNMSFHHYDEKNNFSQFLHVRGKNTYPNKNLKFFFSNVLRDIPNIKSIADLHFKSTNFTGNKNSSNNSNLSKDSVNTTNNTPNNIQSNLINNQANPFLPNKESIELSSNNQNKFTTQNIYNLLNYNGYIDMKGNIRSQDHAQSIKEAITVPEPNDLIYTFDEKLNFAYFSLLERGNVDQYFEYIKRLFDFVDKNIKSGLRSGLLPEYPISFRNTKELESYFIDIMTIDMANNIEKIKIFSVEDDETTKLSQNLKSFSLITYDHKHFAIFLKANKLKRDSKEKSQIENDQEDVQTQAPEELLNNPNLNANPKNTSQKKKNFFGPSSGPSLQEKLIKLNEESLTSISKEEAIKFLIKISSEYNKVFFVSISNNMRKIEYSMDIVNLETD